MKGDCWALVEVCAPLSAICLQLMDTTYYIVGPQIKWRSYLELKTMVVRLFQEDL